jgi:hypothetical protein
MNLLKSRQCKQSAEFVKDEYIDQNKINQLSKMQTGENWEKNGDSIKKRVLK